MHLLNKTKLLKLVLLLKVSFLALYVLTAQNILVLGEKNIQASSPASPSAQRLEQQKAASYEPLLSDDEDRRQGFLEGLLDLPPLQTESTQKDEIGRYLTLVERAKQQVEDRLKVLNQRASQLEKLEQSIDQKLKALDEERKFFARTIQKEKEIQQERLDTLVEFYSKMEPKKAAPVLEDLDKDLVVALFKKMEKKQITRILELMSPEKSVTITEYFGRIGSAKEYDLLKEMNASLQLAFQECKGLPSQASSPEL